jgi:hypothetical protein
MATEIADQPGDPGVDVYSKGGRTTGPRPSPICRVSRSDCPPGRSLRNVRAGRGLHLVESVPAVVHTYERPSTSLSWTFASVQGHYSDHRLDARTPTKGISPLHSAPVAYPAPNGRPSKRGNFFTSDSHTLTAGCEPECRGRSGTKVAPPRVRNPILALLAALLPRQARPSQGGGTGSNPIGAARKRAGQ